jgi:hypothetical protein
MAEEQPVAPRRLERLPLVQERAERRNAGAGPDHDDRPRRIVGQREMLRLLHIDPDLVAGRRAAAQEGRAHAKPHALVDLVPDRIDRKRHARRVAAMRGGDRIDARLQRIECFDEILGVGADAGKFMQGREHVEHRGIAVGILAGGKTLGFLPPPAAGQIGNELEQHVRRRRKRDAVGELVAESAVADGKVSRHVEGRERAGDQIVIVGREHAEGIANLVVEIGAGKIDVDVPGLLFRARLVEPASAQKGRGDRIVAGAAGSRGGGSRLRRDDNFNRVAPRLSPDANRFDNFSLLRGRYTFLV